MPPNAMELQASPLTCRRCKGKHHTWHVKNVGVIANVSNGSLLIRITMS